MSETCGRTTCGDSRSATSSPGSADGRGRCVSPTGLTIDLPGLARALASLSARQAEDLGLLTSGTFGRTGTISSSSATLQSSLASRLRERLASAGSTECSLIWKEAVTPAGRRLCRLAVSARRTDANGSGLWPTPAVSDATGGKMPPPGTTIEGRRPDGGKAQVGLSYAAKALWPTASATDGGRGGRVTEGMTGVSLPQRIMSALWPTATATDGRRTPSGAPTVNVTLNHAALWATPTARDHKSPLASAETHARNSRPLSEQVGAAMWATPTAGDGSKLDATAPVIEKRLAAGRQVGVAGQVRVFGPTPNGSSERTERPGALNPEFVCWLMGYPPEWLSCAPSATRSSRKLRPSS